VPRRLRGDDRALGGAHFPEEPNLILTLEPEAQDKAEKAKEQDARLQEISRKLQLLAGVDPDKIRRCPEIARVIDVNRPGEPHPSPRSAR
jgi:hypothetical protein